MRQFYRKRMLGYDDLVFVPVAVPEVAGHPTGGAVDITIAASGADLPMGTRIADFSNPEKIQTFAREIHREELENRFLLRRALMSAGFAPFDGEWWHFSYGDREWAAYYGKRAARYGSVEISMNKKRRPMRPTVRYLVR